MVTEPVAAAMNVDTLTLYLGVREDDAGLYHLLSVPTDVEPGDVPGMADTMLANYPGYDVPVWVASTGPDEAGTTQLVAEHYGVDVVPAPGGQLVATPAPVDPLAAVRDRA